MLESFLEAWDSSVRKLDYMHSDFDFKYWIYRDTNLWIVSKEYDKIIIGLIVFYMK